ncbi:MAG: phosphoglucomutase/phosphomannomutase family protein [Dehalococcoidia bacterium]
MAAIKFGTDGWRAVIADDFTFDNLRAVTQATAEYLKSEGQASDGVVVGYDTRFLSAAFARATAEVLAGNDIPVFLTSTHVPTPVLSHAVQERGVFGLMITASHNPARWNGFKVKLPSGAPATETVTGELERLAAEVIAEDRVQRVEIGDAEKRGSIERFDPAPAYLNSVRSFVDIEAVRNAGMNVLVDSMYGAAAGWTASAVAEGPTRIRELHGERNPSFPGLRAPEPIASNLGEFLGLLAQDEFAIGLATDGDGDRFGMGDEHGRFVTQLQTFALLVYYLLEVRGERGPIIRSINTTRMVDRLAERYGCEVHETPVGFKHLSAKMTELDALIAGEESAGFGFRGHIPERDGVLSGLYMLDCLTQTKQTPSELLADLQELVGPHEYDRVDVTLRANERDEIQRRVADADPSEVGGIKVTSRDTLDGFRFTLEGDWWLLLRFSGTEPLLRIYAEMPSVEQLREALEAGQELAGVTL